MALFENRTPFTKVYRSSFVFVADRWEEWQGGYCISSGAIDTAITAKVRGNSIYFDLSYINGLRILKSFGFDIFDVYACVLDDRVQYMTYTDFNPIVPVVCNLFYTRNNIDYVRFAMTNPDRLIEFYGHVKEMTSL